MNTDDRPTPFWTANGHCAQIMMQPLSHLTNSPAAGHESLSKAIIAINHQTTEAPTKAQHPLREFSEASQRADTYAKTLQELSVKESSLHSHAMRALHTIA